ncbi:hypothetical protein C8R43DRAFT_952788 [Mycena crocata]|nr:hypothetical protein C8R43DRAFT_952788 [Mycena crocata]
MCGGRRERIDSAARQLGINGGSECCAGLWSDHGDGWHWLEKQRTPDWAATAVELFNQGLSTAVGLDAHKYRGFRMHPNAVECSCPQPSTAAVPGSTGAGRNRNEISPFGGLGNLVSKRNNPQSYYVHYFARIFNEMTRFTSRQDLAILSGSSKDNSKPFLTTRSHDYLWCRAAERPTRNALDKKQRETKGGRTFKLNYTLNRENGDFKKGRNGCREGGGNGQGQRCMKLLPCLAAIIARLLSPEAEIVPASLAPKKAMPASFLELRVTSRGSHNQYGCVHFTWAVRDASNPRPLKCAAGTNSKRTAHSKLSRRLGGTKTDALDKELRETNGGGAFNGNFWFKRPMRNCTAPHPILKCLQGSYERKEMPGQGTVRTEWGEGV